MRRWTALTGLAACLLATSAAAQEFDPNQIRVITPTEATSTCIGDPKTPVCAVETMLACSVRRQVELCHRIGLFNYAMPDGPASTLQYRIISTRIIREEDIPPELQDSYWMKPGFAEVVMSEVGFRLPWCKKDCEESYMLMPTSDGWHYVDHSVEGVEDDLAD